MAIMTSTEPRYRYFDKAPERITVPLSELLNKIPPEFRQGSEEGEYSGRTVDLNCSQLFDGNTPRLPIGTLQDLLPDLILLPEGRDRTHRISLPAGWLALHYRLITRREELPPEPGATEEIAPATVIPVETTNDTAIADREEGKAKSVEVKVNDGDSSSQEPPAMEKKRGFFSSLPIFKRREREIPSGSEPVPVIVEAKTPVSDPIVEEDSIPDVPLPELQSPLEIPALKEESTQEPAMTLERLWKLDPIDQLADPTALQSLFMTEEKLTLERVLAHAGQLPGLKACVLAHGDQVVCSSSAPAGVDLRTLSAQAMTMLAQIRDSSSQMGLGSVPAVTLHAERGVLSFLHQGELCLLVLHADRGFVPGVRERLQEMLGHLSSAKALPGGPSAQPSLPI